MGQRQSQRRRAEFSTAPSYLFGPSHGRRAFLVLIHAGGYANRPLAATAGEQSSLSPWALTSNVRRHFCN